MPKGTYWSGGIGQGKAQSITPGFSWGEEINLTEMLYEDEDQLEQLIQEFEKPLYYLNSMWLQIYNAPDTDDEAETNHVAFKFEFEGNYDEKVGEKVYPKDSQTGVEYKGCEFQVTDLSEAVNITVDKSKMARDALDKQLELQAAVGMKSDSNENSSSKPQRASNSPESNSTGLDEFGFDTGNVQLEMREWEGTNDATCIAFKIKDRFKESALEHGDSTTGTTLGQILRILKDRGLLSFAFGANIGESLVGCGDYAAQVIACLHQGDADYITDTFTEITTRKASRTVHGLDKVDHGQCYFHAHRNIYATLGYFYKTVSLDGTRHGPQIVVAKPFNPGLPKGLFYKRIVDTESGVSYIYTEAPFERHFPRQHDPRMDKDSYLIGAPYDMRHHIITARAGKDGSGEPEDIGALDLLEKQQGYMREKKAPSKPSAQVGPNLS